VVGHDAELFVVFVDVVEARDVRVVGHALVDLDGLAQALEPRLLARLPGLEHPQHRVEPWRAVLGRCRGRR
jgi:hypothetical protein